ncbi:mycothiol conjugate amidase Mca [Nocardia sp. NBC_00511]|uniref:mycothiol conjugate amidase Mca n=1 Tax=Nocardia sp. NBC_00511 TaxID=2903591 RepID=UPI0030DEE294
MDTRPASYAGFRLMAVHAHPDDESSKGAATIALYSELGAEVMVCTMTAGERGDILNPAVDRPEVQANLIDVRRQEMASAAAILGIQHRFVGFIDSGLPAEGEPLPADSFAMAPLPETTAALVRLIRDFRPHVIVTYDENGGYPHPDHIKTHQTAVAAFTAAADATHHPETGAPWQPLKLYYTCTHSKSYFQAIYQAMTTAGLTSPHSNVLDEWDDSTPTWEITTQIPCAAHFPTRHRALLAHETQVDPNGPAMSCPVPLEMTAWPTEDYHLAYTHVSTTFPENDLFAGIELPTA